MTAEVKVELKNGKEFKHHNLEPGRVMRGKGVLSTSEGIPVPVIAISQNIGEGFDVYQRDNLYIQEGSVKDHYIADGLAYVLTRKSINKEIIFHLYPH